MKEHVQTTRLAGEIAERLLSAGSPLHLQPGQILYHASDESDALYLIREGCLHILRTDASGHEKIVAEIGPGDFAGQVQILTGGRHGSTIRAVTSVSAVRVPKEAIDSLAEIDDTLLPGLHQLALDRLRRYHLAAILPERFGALDFRQMEEIESLGRWVRLKKADALFRQDEEADGACLLVSGLLRVQVRASDGTSHFANLIRHGEIVGEMASLSDMPRSASVFAVRESELLFFSKRRFDELLERYPRFTLAIARMNIERLRQSISMAAPTGFTSVTAVLPHSRDVPVPRFTRRLEETLSQSCSVLHLDRKRLQSILGAPDTSRAAREILVNTRFPAWLCEQEGKYRYILLETDLEDEQWTESCLRQSDHALVVGLGSADSSDLSPIESRHIFRDRGPCEIQTRLILIHPDDCERPHHTSRWLKHRNVEMHHHLRLGNDGDFRRLARFLTGSAVCVALGGGGARGFAHIGAFRAFHEAGLPIDIIGGTSMGAVIGAEHAAGMSPGDMLRASASMFSNSGLIRDLTLPLLAFTTGKAYAGTLRGTFGDLEIEDLWIPYFCVSSNISRAERAIHRNGSLWRKVRASSSVQGMFPPVVIDGELHVDGAPFANLPADAMKTVCDGKVIAIDVTPPIDLVSNSDYGDAVSGWSILWRKWFPGRRPFRCADLGTIMQRAGEAVSISNQKKIIERMADYYIRMPVENIGLFSFSALPQLEQIGYESARAKIDEWRIEGRWFSGSL